MRSAPFAICCLLAACADDVVAPAPPSTVTRLAIEAEARDSAGAAMPGATAWLEPHRRPKGEENAFRSPAAVADEAGTIRLQVDSFDLSGVDSVSLVVAAPGCRAPAAVSTILPPELTPDSATVSRTITIAQTTPMATGGLGVLCADLFDTFWGYGSSHLWLAVESASAGVLGGRWITIYRRTSAGYEGTFVGREVDGQVVLALTDIDPSTPCREVRLYATVNAGGAWSAMTTLRDDGGCLEASAPFMLRGDSPQQSPFFPRPAFTALAR